MSTIIPTGMDEITGQFKMVQPGDVLSTADNGTAGTATVAGGAGIALFYATDTGLVGGNALYKDIKFVHANFQSNDPNFGRSIAWSGDFKTITINCKQQTFSGVTVLGVNVLGSNTVGNAPNGTILNVLVQGTLA